MGLVCPGGRTAGSRPGDDDAYPPMGRPMEKEQEWMANFDISEMNLKCRNPKCLVASSHVHQHARGSVKLPEGRWLSLAAYSGRYSPELSTLYAACLKRALDGQGGAPVVPEQDTALRRRAEGQNVEASPRRGCRAAAFGAGTSRGRTPQYVLKGGVPEPVDGPRDLEGEFREAEPEEVVQRRREELDKDAKLADARWKERADKKEWDTVRVDLAVYSHSGVRVDKDPRITEDYRNRVVEGLGFGAGQRDRHPELSEADIAAAREVVSRKSGAFWLEGSPRTTVRFVKHDTIPTGPPVRTPPHNLKGEAADWVDQKLQEEVARGQLERGTSPWGSPPFPTREFAEHRKQRKRRIVVDYRRVNARTLRSVYYVRNASEVVSDAAGSVCSCAEQARGSC